MWNEPNRVINNVLYEMHGCPRRSKISERKREGERNRERKGRGKRKGEGREREGAAKHKTKTNCSQLAAITWEEIENSTCKVNSMPASIE